MVAMAAVREAPRIARAIQDRREQGRDDGDLARRPRPSAAPPSGPRARPPTTRPPSTRRSADVAREVVYAPAADGDADPGEVVWTWVPYEDYPDEGKDRPVLVVGRSGGDVLCLLLSARDHGDEPDWLRLGPGGWDPEGRPSWVRLDRVLAVDPAGVRREGAVLDRGRFDEVSRRLRTGYGWR